MTDRLPEPVRRLLRFAAAVWLVAGLAPGAGSAARAADFGPERYEGLLIPDEFDVPIPLSVVMQSRDSRVTGSAKAGMPLGSEGTLEGRTDGVRCLATLTLRTGVRMRLLGPCTATIYDGEYKMYVTERDTPPVRGTFRLNRIRPEPAKADEDGAAPRKPLRADVLPAQTLTGCLKSNNLCLAGCPRGDYNAEFLCSNRCRSKLNACKKQIPGPAAPIGGVP